MKPKPFSALNHFTVPLAINKSPSRGFPKHTRRALRVAAMSTHPENARERKMRLRHVSRRTQSSWEPLLQLGETLAGPGSPRAEIPCPVLRHLSPGTTDREAEQPLPCLISGLAGHPPQRFRGPP